MQQITYITVDVGRESTLPPIIPAKQGNTGRYVQATVNDKGVPFNMSNATALIRIRKPDNTACVYDEGVSISDNVVVFPLVPQALAAAGMAKGEIDFYNSEADHITTFDFWVDIKKNAVSDAEIVSSDYYNILTAQIAQILSTNTIVKPLGYYATLTALKAGVPSPNPGDMYAVGTAAPYNYYVWDGVGQQWVNNGPLEGTPGTPGATFTPIVYSDGVLAWTNDAGLDNPEPVNITGPVGPPGTGLDILGYYAALEALMTDVTAPAAGDTYGVGLAAPYDIYVWDGVGQQWVNNGQLEGVPGVTFTPSVAADGTLSWTNDGGFENPAPVNIKGADGPTGPAGPNRITADTATDINGIFIGDGSAVGGVDVLPVIMGGTGSNNAEGALVNLGIPYERGSWTPVLSSFSGAEPDVEYEYRAGNYVKIGNIVYVSCTMKYSIGADAGGAGPVIRGLPFNSIGGSIISFGNLNFLKVTLTDGADVSFGSQLIDGSTLHLAQYADTTQWAINSDSLGYLVVTAFYITEA